MKLGISYPAFDGHEILEPTLRSIRREVDFVCVLYQTTSYFGHPAPEDLEPTVKKLKEIGLIDKLIHYKSDLTKPARHNEINIRNLGRLEAKKAGCTHHITSDVDEIFKESELAYAKKAIGDRDCLVAEYEVYFKHPRYKIHPSQNLKISLIHKVDIPYEFDGGGVFPFKIDPTRQPATEDCLVLRPDEFIVHHMSFVRRDIRLKMESSSNKPYYRVKKFYPMFDKYQLGDLVCLLPDWLNRRTVLVDDIFGVEEAVWGHNQLPGPGAGTAGS